MNSNQGNPGISVDQVVVDVDLKDVLLHTRVLLLCLITLQPRFE